MNKVMHGLPTGAAVLVAFAALAFPSTASAQAYPNRSVRIIVPYGPGGGSDTMARVLADSLRQALGQPFVVENRPAGGSAVALDYVARSTPDGYTVVISPNSLSYAPALAGSKFDAVKDVAPIIMVSQAPIVIGGHPDMPFKTIRDLVSYAKANPGKLAYASCGAGGLQHLAMESLKKAAAIDVLHVPYEGCGKPLPDMLAGRVQVYASVMNSVSEPLRAGQLKAYGISNSTKAQLLPDVPTISESGYPGVMIDNWIGIFAPAAAPDQVVTVLNTEINKVLARPETREKMATLFIEPVGGSPKVLGDAVKSDGPRYAVILKDLGITSLQ